MDAIYLTKSGNLMNMNTRTKIIKVMTDINNDGLSKKQVAEKCNISLSTLNNYLTTETWQDIRKLRLSIVSETLSRIDQAIFAKAIDGDLAAAKLVYSRWDADQDKLKELKKDEKTRTIEQIDNEIESIKQQIKKYSTK
ncbi:MAG: winged helix-turn-helix transcriptional regulator [Proteobacteria bacterium]|nr:winged helix-turn-helix transcriptional regulator [Pseudomonadota bacterium]